MPHCILEYSSNLSDRPDFSIFFADLHGLFEKQGAFELKKIKSRAIERSNYYVGDGSKENGFVYLQISILSGRSIEIRKSLGAEALELLRALFPQSSKNSAISMTVEIREIDKETHFS